MKRRFTQLDVFGAAPLRGNPLAVVHDAEGLSDDAMAAFARWTNLSETTFLLPPSDAAQADYRVRIFTPGGGELAFAGHPTLGTCHAWLAAGGVPRGGDVVQQCGIGLVRVRSDGARLAFAAPPITVEPVEPAFLERVTGALGLDRAAVRDAAWLVNGPRLLALQVDGAQRVLALEPDHAALKSLAKVGVIGPQPPGSDTAYEVRFFAAPAGIPEDPVTGMFNAYAARWLIGAGRAPDAYVVSQGTRLERAGRVHVRRDGDEVWIGGDVAVCIEGQVRL